LAVAKREAMTLARHHPSTAEIPLAIDKIKAESSEKNLKVGWIRVGSRWVWSVRVGVCGG
jgi:hypothetical protein